ncbi:preprotein translocase subunit SecY [Halomarina ordinaria]|uniref:Protein translocase subunit SecY n=1 Tax=Halomarina ordinaria TaxID=3033939 RepID=A0ABD5U8W1_9EURY|nr:preprotein translocase subunit SecY [Halomarina sp. PSRA2]
MSWKETAAPVLTRMPTVSRPEGHVPFRRKLTWTAGVLVLYFFLTNVLIWGLQGSGTDAFGQFRTILAGGQGSILQLGIGPIVTASIVLQLLGGANLLGLDTNDPRDQSIYQGLQKLLVVVMIFLTGIPLVFFGNFLPASPQLAGELGTSLFAVQVLIFAQIAVGGLLILFMDEVISKWGVGSGVGLFIIAGVSQALIGGFFGWSGLAEGAQDGFFATWFGILTGQVQTGPLTQLSGIEFLLFGEGELLALFTTLLIFGIVVYAESVRVEIPLSHSRVRGARGRFPVKLIYASVLPMILVRALQANIQFLGRILVSQSPGQQVITIFGTELPWLGTYTAQQGQLQPSGGLFYYFAPIYSPQEWIPALSTQPVDIFIRIGVDLTFMVIGGAIFAIFWVETTGMGPEATAQQIQRSGMQIPGFRKSPGVIEKVLERYIPQVTVIGGALVGLLAVAANMLGTIGTVSGTGLLLTVSITYKLYEEIAEEQLMEMHPMMRQMFGANS